MQTTEGCPDHDVLMLTPGTPMAHLILDQDMDDFDLEAALRDLPDHAIVQLGPITLRLLKPATLTKPLTLVGSGLHLTRIVCQTSALGGVLNFHGDGPWALSHLSVERVQAEAQPDDARRRCVLVEGQIDITACRFLGAPGAGLFLGGQSRGLVTQCEARHNQTGILLSGRATLHIKDNACSNNSSDGIGYVGYSGGLAQDNRCESNQGHGIRVGGQADPTLADNHCLHNHGCGILCSANATAKGNLCCENAFHGISVVGGATPSLEANHCLHNKISGMAYYGNAAGGAKRNQCCQNDWFGIQVSGKARPTLEGNHCLHNKHHGMVYSGRAAGTAKGNDCSNNARYGIFVSDQAAPKLEVNDCQWNKLARIWYSKGTGTVTPSPPLKPHLVLDRDISGFDLQSALDGLPDHAIVQLGAITLSLKRPVIIRKPLTLRGSGLTKTHIIFRALSIGGVLNFQGEGPWVLSDLSVEREASIALDMDGGRGCCVHVEGEIQATRCRFLGARGAGLHLGQRSRGLVSECHASNNLVGISLSDHAIVNLKDNVCLSNGSFGIGYLGHATGLAQGNRCENNQSHGIFVGDQAAPTLEANHCSWNKQNGIVYLGSAAGSARENHCAENDGCGFQIGEQATPTLEANHCLSNKGSGIVYYGSATGISKGNDCSENDGYGIFVGGLANPTVDANRCWGNKSGGPSPSWPR